MRGGWDYDEKVYDNVDDNVYDKVYDEGYDKVDRPRFWTR